MGISFSERFCFLDKIVWLVWMAIERTLPFSYYILSELTDFECKERGDWWERPTVWVSSSVTTLCFYSKKLFVKLKLSCFDLNLAGLFMPFPSIPSWKLGNTSNSCEF
jgi:hypothetical protein